MNRRSISIPLTQETADMLAEMLDQVAEYEPDTIELMCSGWIRSTPSRVYKQLASTTDGILWIRATLEHASNTQRFLWIEADSHAYGTALDHIEQRCRTGVVMFRVVCMKHKCQLVGELTLKTKNHQEYTWHLGVDTLWCPEFDIRFEQIDTEVYGTPPEDADLFHYTWPEPTEEQTLKAQELKNAEVCQDRWYVIDQAGFPVYMTPHDKDKEAFAKASPFESWRRNLGIQT